MAEKDITEKTLLSYNDVFADIYNGLIFQGRKIIFPDSLKDTKARSQFKTDNRKLHEEERDISKIWDDFSMNLVLMGVENQTSPDKDMPLRVIAYDGASYKSQLLDKANKKRYPVVTIILYFGTEPWNTPVNLCDCFKPPLPKNAEMDILKKYIQNYHIHVFDISSLSKEQINYFQSDFRIVADYFVNVKRNKNYRPDNVTVHHVDEFLKLMSVMTGDNRYEHVGTAYSRMEKKRGIGVCELLDRIENEGIEKGIEKGIEQGTANKTLQCISNLLKRNFALEEALEIAECTLEEYEAYKAEYGMGKEFYGL